MLVGPCEDCARTRREKADRKRDSVDYRKLYKTEKWKQLSRHRLALHPWCVGFPLGYHGAARTLAQCTDHIKPAHRYPELFFDEANHQSLCFDCNTRKGQEDGSLPKAEPNRATRIEQRTAELLDEHPNWTLRHVQVAAEVEDGFVHGSRDTHGRPIGILNG